MKITRYDVWIKSTEDEMNNRKIDSFFSSAHATMFKRGMEKGLEIAKGDDLYEVEIQEVESE